MDTLPKTRNWLTLILLTWTIWRAPTNASKWRMGFNSAFKGLKYAASISDIFWLSSKSRFLFRSVYVPVRSKVVSTATDRQKQTSKPRKPSEHKKSLIAPLSTSSLRRQPAPTGTYRDFRDALFRNICASTACRVLVIVVCTSVW